VGTGRVVDDLFLELLGVSLLAANLVSHSFVVIFFILIVTQILNLLSFGNLHFSLWDLIDFCIL
jgi:hypothetical protein